MSVDIITKTYSGYGTVKYNDSVVRVSASYSSSRIVCSVLYAIYVICWI